jgi:hypothetical protein
LVVDKEEDMLSEILIAIVAVLGIQKIVRYRKSSNVNCHFCKRRGMWHRWKDKAGLPRPICNMPTCIERAMEEEMIAVWA